MANEKHGVVGMLAMASLFRPIRLAAEKNVVVETYRVGKKSPRD